jgi:hypothetical protein
METWSSRLGAGRKARLTTFLCKNMIVAKNKQVKTGCNLAEYSEEGYGSKRAVFADDDDADEKSNDQYVSWKTHIEVEYDMLPHFGLDAREGVA